MVGTGPVHQYTGHTRIILRDCAQGPRPHLRDRIKMAARTLEFEYLSSEQEKQVLDLLRHIEREWASDGQLQHIKYELNSIVDLSVSETSPTSVVTDGYVALRQSERYSSIALSLVCYIVDHAMPCQPLNDLQGFINKMTVYKTEVKAPKLVLRHALARIAFDLTTDEVDSFVTIVTKEMRVNPDRLGKPQIFKLFEKMEERKLIEPTCKELTSVAQVLTDIKRNDLQESLEQHYNPDHPIRVSVVMEAQCKYT